MTKIWTVKSKKALCRLVAENPNNIENIAVTNDISVRRLKGWLHKYCYVKTYYWMMEDWSHGRK